MAAPLPDAPADAGVYPAQLAAHAVVEDALSLAQRFAMHGDIYQVPGEISGTTDYLITDGRQSLRVRSADYFTYTADIIKSFNYFGAVQKPDAETLISEFLQTHGLTFPYRMEWSDLRNGYMVQPLSADNTPLSYEHLSSPMLLVTLDEAGHVATLQAGLLDVSGDPLGRYGILSAGEALQRLLDPSTSGGMIEGMNSAPLPIRQWKRIYPAGQTVTIYGTVFSAAPVQPGRPAFIQIDGFPAVGQVSGLDKLAQPAYVEATGQFALENGIEKFNVKSWKMPELNEDGLIGTLDRRGDQVVLTTQDGPQYVLPDVPADVSLPFENAFVVGTRTGDIFEWKLIDDRMATQGGGGGGGGGGLGFYKLNLTGTPVPFPSPTEVSGPTGAAGSSGTEYVVKAGDTLSGIAYAFGMDVDSLMQVNGLKDPGMLMVGQTLVIPGSAPRQIEGLRGILSVTISRQPDGSQVVAYGFLANTTSDPGGYMLLDGNGLEALQGYNSRPVDIWGTLETSSDNGILHVKVERFEIPFPDLKVQVLQGTQKLTEINGQPATLLIADTGETYVQLLMDGTTGSSLIGVEGDQVQVECIAVPGELLGGYPSLRVFGGMLEIDPKTGLHANLPITADRPAVIEVPIQWKARRAANCDHREDRAGAFPERSALCRGTGGSAATLFPAGLAVLRALQQRR